MITAILIITIFNTGLIFLLGIVYERVLDYINDCVDAISYRNTLQRIQKLDEVEDETRHLH